MTNDYKAGRQTVHLRMSDEEFNRRLGAVAEAFGLDWLSAGDHPLQLLWQRKDGFAVNQLCLLGDAIAGLVTIDRAWTNEHVAKIKNGTPNERRGSMFELLAANLFRHPPQLVNPTKRGNPGYDLIVKLQDGGEVDVSLKGYGTSAHEAFFRQQAATTEQRFIKLLGESGGGGVLMAIASKYPSMNDWEELRSALSELPLAEAVQLGVWSVKICSLPKDYEPYSPHHLSFQVFMSGPFHKNESKNLSYKFDEAFANAEAHASIKADGVRVVVMRIPERMSLWTCDKWAKQYVADNPNSPIDAVYLYQISVVDLPDDQSVISHSFCTSETARFSAWRVPAGKGRRILSLNLAVGQGTDPTRVEMRGGPTPVRLDEVYLYQKGEFYTVHRIDPKKPTNAWIRNLASGIFQYAVLADDQGHMTLGGIFPPNKEITLFD